MGGNPAFVFGSPRREGRLADRCPRAYGGRSLRAGRRARKLGTQDPPPQRHLERGGPGHVRADGGWPGGGADRISSGRLGANRRHTIARARRPERGSPARGAGQRPSRGLGLPGRSGRRQRHPHPGHALPCRRAGDVVGADRYRGLARPALCCRRRHGACARPQGLAGTGGPAPYARPDAARGDAPVGRRGIVGRLLQPRARPILSSARRGAPQAVGGLRSARRGNVGRAQLLRWARGGRRPLDRIEGDMAADRREHRHAGDHHGCRHVRHARLCRGDRSRPLPL